jgi:hypothetical protein
LCPRNRLPEALKDFYDTHNKKFPPGIPSDQELKTALVDLLGSLEKAHQLQGAPPLHPPNGVYILIDALDELPVGPYRTNVLQMLTYLSSLRIPYLHILVTSREESDISTALNSWDSLLIDKSKVALDIKLYVSNEIDKHLGLSSQKKEMKEQIVGRLAGQGHGM